MALNEIRNAYICICYIKPLQNKKYLLCFPAQGAAAISGHYAYVVALNVYPTLSSILHSNGEIPSIVVALHRSRHRVAFN